MKTKMKKFHFLRKKIELIENSVNIAPKERY